MNASKRFLGCALLILVAPLAHATKCGQVVYNKHGMLRKYEVLPLNLTEAVKKHGVSSTSGATTEGSTASTDPGVSTGASDSQTQSTSTKGDCKWGGLFGFNDQQDFKNYVQQNMNEIKNQISAAQGGHIEVLAAFSSCKQAATLGRALQKNMDLFVDLSTKDSAVFVERIQNMISKDVSLSNQCQSTSVARN